MYSLRKIIVLEILMSFIGTTLIVSVFVEAGSPQNGRGSAVNATYNYWGSADGPGGYGNGHGDEVDKNIIFEPWLKEPNPSAGPR